VTFWGQIWGCCDDLRPPSEYAKRCSIGQRIHWGGNSPKAITQFEKSQKSAQFWDFRGPVAPKRRPLAGKCPVRTLTVWARAIAWWCFGDEKSKDKNFFSKISKILICPHLGVFDPTDPQSPPDPRPPGVRGWCKRQLPSGHRDRDISIRTKKSYPPRSSG